MHAERNSVADNPENANGAHRDRPGDGNAHLRRLILCVLGAQA